MRLLSCATAAVAVVGAFLSSPAAATITTIVQGANSYTGNEGIFSAFDPSLGILHHVTLTVTTTEFRWLEASPAASPVDFTWSVNGNVSVGIYSVLTNAYYPTLYEPVSTSGSGTIGANGLQLPINVTGSQTFDLDPSFFIGDHALNPGGWYYPDIFISEVDPAMWYGGDITLTSNGPTDLHQVLGCGLDNTSPQEWCDHTDYILTYAYTPVPNRSSVPEPSTWATMLFGFGIIGGSFRRSKSVSRVGGLV